MVIETIYEYLTGATGITQYIPASSIFFKVITEDFDDDAIQFDVFASSPVKVLNQQKSIGNWFTLDLLIKVSNNTLKLYQIEDAIENSIYDLVDTDADIRHIRKVEAILGYDVYLDRHELSIEYSIYANSNN